MTEKRFILVEYVNKGLFIQDNANDETQYFQGSQASLEKVVNLLNDLSDENEQLKASLYAEKTNTAEVVNDYSKQFKRHSAQFSFMMDLADDLGVDVTTLEALDD